MGYMSTVRSRAVLVGMFAAALLATAAVRAHDIPNDVIVHAFIKPEGQRLRLLVRVPLKAMMDVEFPTRGPGYLDIGRIDAPMRTAATVWIAQNIQLYEEDARLPDGQLLAVRASLPSDQSFQRYVTALAHVNGLRLSDDIELPWEQAMLDALLEYPIASDTSRFAIAPQLHRLGTRVTTALRVITPGRAERAFELHDDAGLVRLDPRWHQAAWRFVQSGFFHILGGVDHLLFLLCLVIPLRRMRALVLVVTAFTVAHSITLIGSAYDLAPSALWFPPLVETLIATSIVYMALENITGTALRRRWILTFAFGLVHGFGFSFALRESLQFAGAHLLTSLVAFNLGVEAGQILVLLVLVPALGLLFRYAVEERIGTIIVSALVAHTAWHWMSERAGQLAQFPWPGITVAQLAGAVRVLMLLVAAGAIAWVADVLIRRSRFSRSRTGVYSKAQIVAARPAAEKE
jgi:hypothetical protein